MVDLKEVAEGAEALTMLGADGFILFSIIVVGAMFAVLISVVIFIYKSSRKQHEENEKKIIELTARIVRAEEKARTNGNLNKNCQERLHEAITKLENCTDRLLKGKK